MQEWEAFEREILDYLAQQREASPGQVARALGMSEAGVTSLLAFLASEGKVQIRLVGVGDRSRAA
jgi:DNA-binding IclR family transcriptional regulator